MLLIMAVNHSQGKTRAQLSAVIDQYLDRVDDSVWMGTLSQEGLNELIEDARESRKYQKSVQIFQVHKHRAELIAVVGKAHYIKGIGWPFSRAIKVSKAPKPAPFVRQVMLCAYLAGMGHDLGKVSLPFQQWIRDLAQGKPKNERTKQSVKHEVVSAAFIRALIDGALDWTKAECSQSVVIDDDSIRGIALQVIETHHKKFCRNGLPTDLMYQPSRFEATNSSSISIDLYGAEKMRSFLCELTRSFSKHRATIEGGVFAGKEHSGEATYFKETAGLTFYASRLAMMIADYGVSNHEKNAGEYDPVTEGECIEDDGVAYAKSSHRVPLDEHLKSVASHASHVAKAIFQHQWASLKTVPEKMKAPARGAFSWQAEGHYRIVESGVGPGDGFIGALIGETGSGKTRAGFRFMSALSCGRTRFTLGLGLGALALQSANEYRRDIGLGEKELGVFVGRRHTQRQDSGGEDEDLFVLEDAEYNAPVSLDSHLPDAVRWCTSGRNRRLVSVPVAVMTIDHIMGAMTADRGGYVVAALRVATSDLLIDEIDSFSPSDLHAITRLVHLAGMFGRKVLISSATITPEIFELVSTAYQAGYRQHALAFPGKGRLFTGIFSNRGDQALVCPLNECNPSPVDIFRTFTGTIRRQVLKEVYEDALPGRRKVELLKVDCPESITGFFEMLLGKAVDLAKSHYSHIEGWGKGETYSSGFIRFSHIDTAQRMALWIALNLERLEDDYGVRLRINAYHSALDSKARKKLEKGLDQLLCRKDHGYEDLLKSRIDPEYQKRGRPTLFLLIASPVIEVGRDYDFDFAILEPSSDFSIIQSGGRVRRHRGLPEDPSQPNVFLMDKSVRQIERHLFKSASLQRNTYPFGRPGPGFQQMKVIRSASETKPWGFKESVAATAFLASLDESNVWRDNVYAGQLHNAYRITTAETKADAWDREACRNLLEGGRNNDDELSIRRFIKEVNPYRDTFYDQIKFRDGDNDYRYTFTFIEGKWMPLDMAFGRRKELGEINARAWLFELKSCEGTEIMMPKPGGKPFSDHAYHPCLGVIRSKRVFDF